LNAVFRGTCANCAKETRGKFRSTKSEIQGDIDRSKYEIVPSFFSCGQNRIFPAGTGYLSQKYPLGKQTDKIDEFADANGTVLYDVTCCHGHIRLETQKTSKSDKNLAISTPLR